MIENQNQAVIKEELAETNPSTPLWRHRDYLLLWSGQVVSQTGSQVSQLAFPLLILALTHSPAQAGIAAALRTLPFRRRRHRRCARVTGSATTRSSSELLYDHYQHLVGTGTTRTFADRSS
ncbi:hypothetical protein [Dictyobacter kobayashii]|uniref:Uncharacterized protein n=1 Tax=Dictyobacter kobayashii TaxID=2014872 RepID=A0A402AP74_9CHLR|nr:hypothetical protein [Dictyobacter kobayashii]GCE20770.1 hypothetical protein KDK_45700 [Dictyobacter kobayashii]